MKEERERERDTHTYKFKMKMMLLLSAAILLADIEYVISGEHIPTGLEDSPLTEVRGVLRGRVVLPCDLTPPVENDSTHLVLFYHNGAGTPIYSLDSRGVTLDRGSSWTEDELNNRVFLQLGSEGGRSRGGGRLGGGGGTGGGLVIDDLQMDDEGEYRCRVDFLLSPTRNSRILLSIVVPPESLTITSTLQRDLESPTEKATKVAGPYQEGEEVTLSCQVIGGQPPPQVTWWHEGSLLDDISEINTGHVTRNTLTLPAVTRGDLNKMLTCQAANSDLTFPLSGVVTIDLHYPPSKVVVAGSGQVTVEEDKEHPLVCEVDGARPSPAISWWKDGNIILNGNEEREQLSESRWRSTLRLTVGSGDQGAMITCRAHTPSLPQLPRQDHTTLNVLYKPQLELDLALPVDPAQLEEGDEIYLKCIVEANPPITGIQWAHDGVPLHHDTSEGTLVSDTALVLRDITRFNAGSYTCAAANTQGATTSTSVHLPVKFPPSCASGQQLVYGAARHEELHVPCSVESHPAPVSFRWAVNTSTGVVDVPLNLSSSSGRSSVVKYTPQTHHDFGELLCWAVNEIGRQKDPCVFNIIPAAKPESVTGCVAERNSTMPVTYAVMSCIPGWDGGLNQTFTLEVRQAAREEVLDEFSHASRPFFIITGLKVGVQYLMTVTAANSRGTSPPITISYTAHTASADNLVSPHSSMTLLSSITPILVLLVGVLAAAAACVGLGVLVTRKQRRKKKGGAEILYAGPLRGEREDDVHTIICVNKDCEKEELSRLTPGSFYVNAGSLVNNCCSSPLETDVLLRGDTLAPATTPRLAPLASIDSLGRCSTASSVCTTSSNRPPSSRSSSSTVALNPDYLVARGDIGGTIVAPLVVVPRESAV